MRAVGNGLLQFLGAMMMTNTEKRKHKEEVYNANNILFFCFPFPFSREDDDDDDHDDDVVDVVKQATKSWREG